MGHDRARRPSGDPGEQTVLRRRGDPGLPQHRGGIGSELHPATALRLCHREALERRTRGEQEIRRQLHGVLRARVETLGQGLDVDARADQENPALVLKDAHCRFVCVHGRILSGPAHRPAIRRVVERIVVARHRCRCNARDHVAVDGPHGWKTGPTRI